MQPRLSRVVLYVKDAAASARWYAERFGFTTRFERPEEGWVELDAGGGCTLAFHTVDNPHEWRAEIAIAVDQPPALVASLAARGTDVGSRMSTWEHYQWCKGRDLDGQTFQVINRPE